MVSFFNCLFSYAQKWFQQLFLSSVARRIVLLNVAALISMVGGILYLDQFRDGLIETRLKSLEVQGRLISGAIAASIGTTAHLQYKDPNQLLNAKDLTDENREDSDQLDRWNFPINPAFVVPMLRQMIQLDKARARIYDRQGSLLIDSNILYAGNQVYDKDPRGSRSLQTPFFQYIKKIFGQYFHLDGDKNTLEYTGIDKHFPAQIREATDGEVILSKWRNKNRELILSIALPIKRADKTMGVLFLSVLDTDIDKIVSHERTVIIKIFASVFLVMLILSIFLASTIARPLRALAEAANQVRYGARQRVDIPDFSYRGDEVGQLSIAIKEMTKSLYARIESTERFAADVSHELKNPLTSLRSVVETFPLTKTEESKQKLLQIMQHDILRLDRLITDIAHASRLDAELARADIERIDLQDMLSQLVMIETQVNHKDEKVDIRLITGPLPRPGIDFVIYGHELRLSQVFLNLLENARSFVPKNDGKIYIYLDYVEDHIEIVIEDNGPGIGIEDIDRIFERFYTDRPGKENFGQHSGLGLSISKQIIQAHGGELNAENIQGDGRFGQKTGARFIIQFAPPKKGSEE